MNYEETVIYAATGLAEEGSTLFDTTVWDASLQQIVLDVALQARIKHVTLHFHGHPAWQLHRQPGPPSKVHKSVADNVPLREQ